MPRASAWVGASSINPESRRDGASQWLLIHPGTPPYIMVRRAVPSSRPDRF